MHDVLKGSLAYEIKEIVKYFHTEGICSLNKLNEAISMFPYNGSDARNKPSPFGPTLLSSTDHGLRQCGKLF